MTCAAFSPMSGNTASHRCNWTACSKKALRIIEAHPEYGPYLEDIEQYLDKEWRPEDGEGNPFLHMSLHLSLQEQAAIDQPPGIRAIHHRLCARHGGDWVRAEHEMWTHWRRRCGKPSVTAADWMSTPT